MSIFVYLIVLFSFTSVSTAQLPGIAVYKDSSYAIEQRVDDLLQRMTLEEKVEQLNGYIFSSNGNIRLGIPKIVIYDGESEAKANRHTVNFSANMNWAASFDEELIYRIGVSMGEETRVLGANMLLNPCVNIMRTPFNGRAFEAFGEDPYLVSCMAAAYVKGAQSKNVITCPKHFAVNNQDWNRFDVNVEADERTLREIYLPAYKAAIQQGGAWSIMTAYNMFRGDWCSENEYLLNDILRNEWGFDGFTISDWGGTHSTVKMVKAGLDFEMPKALYYGEKLLEAVKNGQVSEATIDDRARNILRIMFRAGLFDEAVSAYGGIAKTEERLNLALEVARKSIVLLKNNHGLLPLDRNAIKSIAVIGPNGNVARVAGAGSGEYQGYFQVSPLDGIINKVGEKINVKFERGIPEKSVDLPIAGAELYEQPNGEPGLYAEYFNNINLKGEPVFTTTIKTINFNWGYGPIVPGSGPGCPKPGVVNHDKWSARWTGKLVPPGEGLYEIGIKADNGIKLFLDNEKIIDSWTDEAPGSFKVATFDFEKSKKYNIRVEFYENIGSCRCRLGLAPFKSDDSVEKAVNLAKKTDIAILCMGLSDEIEGEQLDKDELPLPEKQIELIKAVVKANPKTIIVLNNGTPVLMNQWIDDVPVVIEAFYPGQEGGNAVADILFGDVNPSGKLPFTIMKRWEDHSAYGTYPGKRDFVEYSEGIFVGYRHFDKNNIEPEFPFGYGLSYTTFKYSDLELSFKNIKQSDTLEVSIKVKNSGKVDGDEIVQLYISDKKASVEREVKSLKGFQRVSLKAGESKTVTMKIDKTALSFYDVKAKKWLAEPGEFELLIGASSRDIRLKDLFELK